MTIAPKFLPGNSTGQSAINFIQQPHLQADTIDQPCFQANIPTNDGILLTSFK